MTETLKERVSGNFAFSCVAQMPPFATTSPKFQRVAWVQEDDESNQSFLVKTWHEAQRVPLDGEEIYLRETKDVVLFYTRTQCETGHRLDSCVDTSHKCHAVLILIHKKCRLDICLAVRAVDPMQDSLLMKTHFSFYEFNKVILFHKSNSLL